MTLNALEALQEFARIRRGEHPGWRGDRIANSEWYLRSVRCAGESAARDLASRIELNVAGYSNATGLPARSLINAQRILSGV